MTKRLIRGVLIVLAVGVWPIDVRADQVTPSDDVTSRVLIRAAPSSQSSQLGSLVPGQQLELLGSVPNWHKIRLTNGGDGFVPKRWTRVISAGAPSSPAPGPTLFTLDVVDVGTGLAILLRGSDFALVYDAGSNDDTARGGSNRMLAFMKHVAPSLATIDHVILSHPHRDHVELLPDLLSAYQVRQVWDSGRVNDICGYRAFLTAVRDEPGVQYHNALQDGGTRTYAFAAKNCYGQSLSAEVLTLTQATRINEQPIVLGQGATMKILYADGASHSSANENSVVVRFDLGTTRILVMGDSEAGGRQNPSVAPTPTSIEGALLACCTGEIAANVLVVGHHGSKTSSRRAFLDAVSPSVIVVSSGPTKYQTVTLPDQEVITELSGRGPVFRTDVADHTCAQNPAKIGPDNDGNAGGCDNVRILVPLSGTPQVSMFREADAP